MPLAETQDLLDRKFDVCFTHADVNGNGVLEPADVLALAARIATYLGEPMGSPKTQKLFQTFEHFWTHVQAKMDVDNDGQVTPEEWRNGLRKSFAEDSEAYKAGFAPLAEAIFTIGDRDGDGFLEPSEFVKFHQAFGCKSANSQLAFQKLDSNGDGQLAVDELVIAWQEYYTSNDPNARGNWLYGDVWDNTVVVGSKTIGPTKAPLSSRTPPKLISVGVPLDNIQIQVSLNTLGEAIILLGVGDVKKSND